VGLFTEAEGVVASIQKWMHASTYAQIVYVVMLVYVIILGYFRSIYKCNELNFKMQLFFHR